MNKEDAIAQSEKGTATRILLDEGVKSSIVGYKDGSGYTLVSIDGSVDFDKSHVSTDKELSGHEDWLPS